MSELEKNRVTNYDVKTDFKSNYDVIANFSLLEIFNENKISGLRNSEILSLFNNNEIPLRNVPFDLKISIFGI